jgi:hypothetical protein
VVGAAGASGVDVSSEPPSRGGVASSFGGSLASVEASVCPESVLSAEQARGDEATSEARTSASP